METKTPICPYCGKPAIFVENKEIYGSNYGKSYMIWLCKPCDAYVGTHHNNPNKPLGSLVNKELRQLRIMAHYVIDSYWLSGRIKRKDLYRLLSHIYGREFHIGESNEVICRAIIETDIIKDSIESAINEEQQGTTVYPSKHCESTLEAYAISGSEGCSNFEVKKKENSDVQL